jgi:NADPH-dependent curcumin reductase CurA
MVPEQVRLTDYPAGRPVRDFWARSRDGLRVPEPGDVVVRIDWISVDPGMTGWITDKRSYMPPVRQGEVMRAFGVGEVIDSRSDRLQVGDWVTGFLGVQTAGVFKDRMVRRIPTELAPPQLFLSGLGMTGYTAYFGMMDLGCPQAGETVVVSAASGAVGSMAAQLARDAGARVIGIAGGEEKCRYLTDQLGLDAAIDYKAGQVAAQLQTLAPDEVDLYFDNVGGDILDTLLMNMTYQGRIVVCGGISQYADWATQKGPANYMQLVTHSLTMRGFTMRDYMHRVPEALDVLIRGWADGRLKCREHIVEGLDRFPEAFDMLFDGRNHGKLMIRVAHAS